MDLNEIKTFSITAFDEADVEKAERLAIKRIKMLTLCKDDDIRKVSKNTFKVSENISKIELR